MKPQETRTEETITFEGGGISTKIPRYDLIFMTGMKAEAQRCERGVRLKGSGSCNSLNVGAALDKEFVIERLGHAIQHCYAAIKRLVEGHPMTKEELEEGGDAGAIRWAGGLLAEHLYQCNNGVAHKTPLPDGLEEAGVKGRKTFIASVEAEESQPGNESLIQFRNRIQGEIDRRIKLHPDLQFDLDAHTCKHCKEVSRGQYFSTKFCSACGKELFSAA